MTIQYTNTEPLFYHRLLRGMPNYRWWKPLVFAVLATVFGFTMTTIVSAVAVVPMVLSGGPNASLEFAERMVTLDTQDPYALFVALVSLAVWIPAILVAGWAVGFRPVGRLWSIRYRIRWVYLFKTLGLAALAFLATQMVAMVWGIVEAGVTGVEPPPVEPAKVDWSVAGVSLVIVFLVVPFQAAAEELMFRGAAMQVLGAWMKNPIIPIALPSLLFALAHFYDPWGLVQVGVLGVVAGVITWRTGGLEAAISLHVVNNVFVFIILASGLTGDTGQSSDTGATPVSTLIQVFGYLLFALMAIKLFDRGRARGVRGLV